MKGKFISVVLTLAVCLGLLLVPAVVEVPEVSATDPPAGTATFQLPAEVEVTQGQTFTVNVTIYNPHSVCMSVAQLAIRWNGTMLSANDITPGAAINWPSYSNKYIGVNNLSYVGAGTVGDAWRNTTVNHAIVNFTAGSTKGVTTVYFCTDAGPYGVTGSKILDTSQAPQDVLDWGSMQNMTVRIVAADPPAGTATLRLPAEVVVTQGQAFTVNVTIYNPHSVCMSSATSALRWNGSMLSANDIAGSSWPAYPGGGKFLGVNNLSLDGIADVSTPWLNTTVNHATVNFTAGSTKGVTLVYFCTDAGSHGMKDSKILDASWPTVDVLDWDSMQNMTVRIVAGFNLTVTSTGCCPIDVSGAVSDMVSAGENKTFTGIVEGENVTVYANDTAVCCEFDSWSDAGAKMHNITMNSDKSVIAYCFVPSYNLTVNVTPVGGGNVTVNGVTPPSYPNSTTWTCGANVTLNAVAASGYSFVNWSGDLSGNTTPTNMTMYDNYTITANFAAITYNLTVNVTPSSGGNVTVNGTTPPSYPNTTTWNYGDNVTLNATVASGYSFVNWSGNLSGNTTPTNMTMYDNYSIVANFVKVTTTLEGLVDFWRATPAPCSTHVTGLEVRFFDNSTKNETGWSPINVTTDDQGNFTIDGIVPGTYDIGIKNWTCLGKMSLGVTVNANETKVVDFGMPIEGDTDDNDMVDGWDYALVLNNYGALKIADPAGWAANEFWKADFNRDYMLDGWDYSTVLNNYGDFGEIFIYTH